MVMLGLSAETLAGERPVDFRYQSSKRVLSKRVFSTFQLCDPRVETFHLFLHGTGRYSAL